MNNISLAVITVMTMSVLIGSSMMYADAVKPQIVETVNLCPDEDPECIETKPIDGVCGIEDVIIKSGGSYTVKEWDNGKLLYTISTYGTVYVSGTGLGVVVGDFADVKTVKEFEGKGATVVKQTSEVSCEDGTKDTIKYKVEVTAPKK